MHCARYRKVISIVLNIEELLNRSAELAKALAEVLTLSPNDDSARTTASSTLCGVSFEHAESVRILIATGNFTSSLGILRMQYEALVMSQTIRSSNGLLVITGMMLVILSGDSRHSGRVLAIQQHFADCCPNLASPHNPSLKETDESAP